MSNAPYDALLETLLPLTLSSSSSMPINLAPLWDFGDPDVSESRFRQALETATGDDALIIHTQIARTYGLRRQFEAAQALLREVEPHLETAGPEARVRYHLELGRTLASGTHTPEQITPEGAERARASYATALKVAREAALDALAIDAIHMFAFIDKAPIDQLMWGQAALQMSLTSSQPDARRWEASIRNNVGYALHQLGRYDEALEQFREAVVLRERGTNASATRVAHWMVAWTLRSLNRIDEALEIQLRLEREGDRAGEPDPYVFEELEALYTIKSNTARAEHYAVRRRAVSKK